MLAAGRNSLRIVFAFVPLFGAATPPAKAAPAEESVRVAYVVPKDRKLRQEYISAFERCVLDLQTWYYGHMGGKTFRVNDPIVEVKKSTHNTGWYNTANRPANDPKDKSYSFYNVVNDVGELFGAKVDDPDFVWLVYIDAPVAGAGAGVKGMCILGEGDLKGLIGRSTDRSPISRWIGGSGHELGHAFGLDHPGEEKAQAIMQYGYLTYPACYLTPDDTKALNDSPFFHAGRPDTFKGRGRFIYVYEGGYLINAGGKRWEEHFVGTDLVFHFEKQDEERDFIHVLDSSREPGIWLSLPKKDKGNSIFFKWNDGESWEFLREAME
jgi:hypothetical protein